VLHKLVDILLHFPSGSHDLSPAEWELDPSHMAIHLIKEVSQGNEMCQEILCKVSNIIYACTKCYDSITPPYIIGFIYVVSD